MRDPKAYTGTITSLDRLPSSKNGNPRFMVHFRSDDGELLTARALPDSMDGYNVKGLEGKHVTATIGWYYGKLSIADMMAITEEA